MSLLDEVIEYLDYARQYQTYIASRCIFHEDTRPSLIIHEDWYNCLACDAKGKTERLLEILKDEPPKPKVTSNFNNPFTRWTKRESLKDALKIAWINLNQKGGSSYLREKRGITEETRYKLKIGWRDGWFTFPILDNHNKVVGTVARADETNQTDSKYLTVAGQDPNLLYVPSWELVHSSGDIYCTFGILDAITIYQLGWAAISTTGGKRLDPTILDKFRKRILFLPDKGEEKDAMQIAKYLGWRGKVLKMEYPDDCKDVNDVWIKHPHLLQSSFQS